MTNKKTDSIKFFFIMSCLAFAFGVSVALFNIMSHPIYSALLALSFIIVGSACLSIATAKCLIRMDEKLHASS